MIPFPGCLVATESAVRFYFHEMSQGDAWLQYKCVYYLVLANRGSVAYDVHYNRNYIKIQIIP